MKMKRLCMPHWNQMFWYWQLLRGRGVHIYTVMDGEIDMGICAMLQEIAGK